MKKKIFKLCYIILIILTLSSIGASNSLAASSDPHKITIGDIPGTDSSLLAIQSRKSQAKQVSDKALRVEIIRAPESVSDLVCLPKLNGNFSGVAKLFSDVKDQVKFSFDISSLCAMALGASTGFGEDLSGLLKVAATGALGLSLPALSICTNPISVGIGFDLGIDGMFGKSATSQFDFLGCAITGSIGVSTGFESALGGGASFGVLSYCMSVSIPLFECKGIGQFAGELLSFMGVDGAAILPISGGGINGGAMYMTQDEEISLLAGGKFSLANALGLDEIKAALNFMTDISLTIDVSASVGASSTDGLTSDGGVNVDGNAAVMAGTGNSFFGAYAGFGASNPDTLALMKSDMETMKGPGAGSLVWNPIPTIGAKVEASAILDLMKVAKDADPTHKPK